MLTCLNPILPCLALRTMTMPRQMIKFNWWTPMETKQHSSEEVFLLVKPNKLGFKLFYSKHFNFENKSVFADHKIYTQNKNIRS